MHRVWQELRAEIHSQAAHENAHWRKAVYLQGVWEVIHPEGTFKHAHALPHGREATQMRHLFDGLRYQDHVAES